MTRAMTRVVMAAAVMCLSAVGTMAQQTSTTETKAFEVIAVEGNMLVVKLPEGTREINVPEDFRFTVNGQQLSVHDLKPAMKGTAVITTRTTSTPVTVTEVKNGTVVTAAAGTIIVRTPEGVKSFNQGDVDKRGVKIVRDGKPAQVSDFRSGDKLSAVIITSKPPIVMTEKEVQATTVAAAAAGVGASASARTPAAASTQTARNNPPAGAPAGGSGSSASGAAASPSSSAQAGGGAAELPHTASSWPLLGLASVLSLAIGFGLNTRRRFVR
jgi:hypothetical protein